MPLQYGAFQEPHLWTQQIPFVVDLPITKMSNLLVNIAKMHQISKSRCNRFNNGNKNNSSKDCHTPVMVQKIIHDFENSPS